MVSWLPTNNDSDGLQNIIYIDQPKRHKYEILIPLHRLYGTPYMAKGCRQCPMYI
jgi:hypothetical protein